MKTFLIVFNQSFKSSNYQNLVTYLKSFAGWAKPFDNVWIIKTDKLASEIRDEIKLKAIKSDAILVIETKVNWGTSNIDKRVTDWMKNNI